MSGVTRTVVRHFAKIGKVVTAYLRSAASADPRMPKKGAAITGEVDTKLYGYWLSLV